MAETSCIPNFAETIASERKDRASCLLGLPELIAGVQCAPLTPRRMEWLRAFNNPFICGGQSSTATVIQFLWFVSLDFKPFDDAARDAFIAAAVELSATDAVEGIGSYLDRAFLDAPHGKPGKPYYAPTIGLYHSLNESYPHGEWTLASVMDTPLPVIYQLIKVDDIAKGRPAINRRSDEVAVKWAETLETIVVAGPTLPSQSNYVMRPDYESDSAFEDAIINVEANWKATCNEIIAAHEQSVIDEIAKRKADGWLLMSQPSQNKDGSYSFAMQRKEGGTNG